MRQTKQIFYQIERQNKEEHKKININQKVNDFIHTNIKQIVGVRAYLCYFRNVVFTPINNNSLAIICSTEQVAEILYNKYNLQICKFVKDTWGKNNLLSKYFYVKDGIMNEIHFESEFIEKPVSKVIYFNEANNKYTFENFVSSGENIDALEICQSVACYSQKELVQEGSIVCIYGSVSTGKTHLINAIGNFYREHGGKVISIAANDFLRKYVDSVQKRDVFNFQDVFLQNEIIIIDDVDDLVGKNGTLIELQRLLAIAVENKKYIVITSSESPKQLANKSVTLNEILSNSTCWKLKEPKEALKTQIIMNYICENNFNVPISIVKDLVLKLDCNVRELKNYIKKLAITQSIRKFELNTNLALDILSDDVRNNEENKHVSNENILSIVAGYYNISVKDLNSKIRRSDVCKARSIAMYLMKKINSLNFQEIGKIFNRNHSTVISSLRNVNEWLNNDKKVPAELSDIKTRIKNIR